MNKTSAFTFEGFVNATTLPPSIPPISFSVFDPLATLHLCKLHRFADVITQQTPPPPPPPMPNIFPLPPLFMFKPSHALVDYLIPQMTNETEQTVQLSPQNVYGSFLGRDGDFTSHYGLSLEEFEVLHKRCYSFIEAPRKGSQFHRITQIDSRNRLLLFLHLLRKGCSFEDLHERFGVNSSFICRDIEHIANAIDSALVHEIDVNTEADIKKLLLGTIPEFPNALGSLDGMAVPLPVFQDPYLEDQVFRKDKGHFINTQFTVNFLKTITGLDTGYKGSDADITVYKYSQLGTDYNIFNN
jgi:hypothetical protein